MANSDIERYGLVGKNISYSFSKKYFTAKFEKEELRNFTYDNFDVSSIDQLPSIILATRHLKGLNITIPYKQSVIPLLDEIDEKARVIGAVNTIKITKNNKLKGFNTDYYGFKKSIQPCLKTHHKKALILGTGGASKAVYHALKELNITCKYVSRNPTFDQLNYTDLTAEIFKEFQIIINCTPLGTFPNIDQFPPIPYLFFTKNHLAFDLIYNPSETSFLRKAREFQATTLNGAEMLTFQAEKAWEIWKK